MVSKEEVVNVYINENLTRKESATKLNIKFSQFLKLLEIYNIKKPKELNIKRRQETSLKKYGTLNPSQSNIIKEKIKETNLERYGVTSVSKLNSIKEKIKETNLEKYGKEFATQNDLIKEKIKNTNLERYGIKGNLARDDIKEKIKKTNLEKYGYESHFSNKEIREKIKNTNIERYGKEFATQNNLIKEKIKNTNLEKYGIDCLLKLPEVIEKAKKSTRVNYNTDNFFQYSESKDKIYNYLNKKGPFNLIIEEVIKTICKDNKKTPYEIADTLDIPYSTVIYYIHQYGLEKYIVFNESILENIITEYLDSRKIKYSMHNRSIISPQEVDFYIPDYNIAIEVNDSVSHNSTIGYLDKTDKKPINYHYNKTKKCSEIGVRLIHLFQHELDNETSLCKIYNYLDNIFNYKIEILYARNCTIREVSSKEASIFINKNHLQGNIGSSIRIGLFYKDNLVEIMTFGKPRFDKINLNTYELIRLCTKDHIRVIGGANKIFKYFLDKYIPDSIVSYCNLSKFTGTIYESLGFKLDSFTKPNYIWTNHKIFFSRYQTQKSNLANIFQDYNNLDEKEFMISKGFVQIYDSGNAKYIFTNKKD